MFGHSASRQETRTLNPTTGEFAESGNWIQVSRLGMPLTNEAVIPVGQKDEWNSRTPYTENPIMEENFCNPELGLYMDDDLFGGAVPAFAPLRIQRNSLQSFDFGNTHDGLWPLRATNAGAGTALDTNLFGNYLLRQGKPTFCRYLTDLPYRSSEPCALSVGYREKRKPTGSRKAIHQ